MTSVIVVSLRIDRDRAAIARLEDRARVALRTVIDSEHHDRAHLRPQRLRIGAALRPRRKVIHVAVQPERHEFDERGLRLRRELRGSHRDLIEAQRRRLAGKRRSDFGRRAQKSRSA